MPWPVTVEPDGELVLEGVGLVRRRTSGRRCRAARRSVASALRTACEVDRAEVGDGAARSRLRARSSKSPAPRPAPHSSFQWKCPPVAKRARARPVIVERSSRSAARTSPASRSPPRAGSRRSARRRPPRRRSRGPSRSAWSTARRRAAPGSAPGPGRRRRRCSPVSTRSAVCSRISRVSSGRSVDAVVESAALTTSAAAPEALPVFSEPVGPSIEIELLPPYWVVLAPRKKVRDRDVRARGTPAAGDAAESLGFDRTGSSLRRGRRCRAPCPGSASRGRSWPGSCGCPC